MRILADHELLTKMAEHYEVEDILKNGWEHLDLYLGIDKHNNVTTDVDLSIIPMIKIYHEGMDGLSPLEGDFTEDERIWHDVKGQQTESKFYAQDEMDEKKCYESYLKFHKQTQNGKRMFNM